jgi:hypothetical protein
MPPSPPPKRKRRTLSQAATPNGENRDLRRRGQIHTLAEQKGAISVLRFCGFDLELFVDDVLDRRDGPALCCARDLTGARWLIVQVDDDPDHLSWMCAQASERAVRAVTDGRASPADVLRHSATGTVELVTIDHGRAVPDRCLPCASVLQHLLSSADRPALLIA